MTDETTAYEATMRQLAEALDSCRKCGKPHQCRWRDPTDQRRGVTWGSEDDGHAFYRVGPEAMAKWLRACAEAVASGQSLAVVLADRTLWPE